VASDHLNYGIAVDASYDFAWDVLVSGWDYFLPSLAAYTEMGPGMPFPA
jgi:hypothetical protein